MNKSLVFILPNGSLGPAVKSYLRPEYVIPEPDRTGFCGKVNGIDFYQLDRRTIPSFVERGFGDAGLTGNDLLIESGVESLDVVCEVPFSRSSERPARWVLAWREHPSYFYLNPGVVVRIGCELPRFAEIVLEKVDFRFEIVPISGSEEQMVTSGLVDMVLVVTESGKSLRANGLDEIFIGSEEMCVSNPVIIAKPDLSDEKRERLSALSATLRAGVGAKSRVMVSCDVPSEVNLDELHLPASVAPTIVPIAKPNWNSCTVCIPLSSQGEVLVALEHIGAKGITVMAVSGYIA